MCFGSAIIITGAHIGIAGVVFVSYFLFSYWKYRQEEKRSDQEAEERLQGYRRQIAEEEAQERRRKRRAKRVANVSRKRSSI